MKSNAQKIQEVLNKLDYRYDIRWYLTEYEKDELEKWENKHREECTEAYQFDCWIGSIGTTIWVVCDCGKKVDITEYRSW